MIAAAKRLGRLRERVVFVGGATTELLITDPGAAEARSTIDVDVIVEVATHAEYVGALRDERVALGFREDDSPAAPMCRWLVDDLIIDIMPTVGAALGFTNRWYPQTPRRDGKTRQPNTSELAGFDCSEIEQNDEPRHRLGGSVKSRPVTDISHAEANKEGRSLVLAVGDSRAECASIR